MLTHQIKGVVAQSRPHESIRHCSSALKRSFRLLSEGRSRAKELAARPHSACSPAACELSLAARGGPRAGRQVGPRARARRSGHSSGPIRAGAEPEGSYWRRGQLCLHRSTAGSRRRLQANLGREHEHGAPHNPPDAQAPQSGRWHKSPSEDFAIGRCWVPLLGRRCSAVVLCKVPSTHFRRILRLPSADFAISGIDVVIRIWTVADPGFPARVPRTIAGNRRLRLWALTPRSSAY